MGPVFVIVSTSVTDDFPGMGQVPKPVFVQVLISEALIDALNKAVLGRLSRLEQLQLNPVVVSPLVQSLAGELRPLVCSDSLRVASKSGYGIQSTGNLVTRDTVSDRDVETLLGEVIDNGQTLNPPTPRQ